MLYKKLRSLYSKSSGTNNDRWNSPLFDAKWYKNFYRLNEKDDPLVHFVNNSKTLTHDPNAFLNVRWYAETYLSGFRPTAREVVEHYYTEGEKQGFLPSGDFDPGFYARTYPDTRGYPDGLLAHYMQIGRIQKRIPFERYERKLDPLCMALHGLDLDNIVMAEPLARVFDMREDIKAFFTSCRRLPEDVPLRFSPANYTAYNPDLADLRDKPMEAIRHYLLHGYKENRLWQDFNAGECAGRFYAVWNIPERDLREYKPGSRICVLVHIFYPDLYEELKEYLGNLSAFEYDIYFNLVENNWTGEFHKRLLAEFPKARVIVSPNRGKDIGGYFNLLSFIKPITQYDSYLLIHTKKSPHIPEAASTKWRTDLLGAALGSPGIVLQNLYLLEKLPDTGLIGSRFWRQRSIDNNTKKYFRLMRALGISKKNYRCDYLSGTMMWLNANVIDYLYSKCNALEFEDGNRRSQEFHKDGQLAHAMERAFGNVCRHLSLNMIFR